MDLGCTFLQLKTMVFSFGCKEVEILTFLNLLIPHLEKKGRLDHVISRFSPSFVIVLVKCFLLLAASRVCAKRCM